MSVAPLCGVGEDAFVEKRAFWVKSGSKFALSSYVWGLASSKAARWWPWRAGEAVVPSWDRAQGFPSTLELLAAP